MTSNNDERRGDVQSAAGEFDLQVGQMADDGCPNFPTDPSECGPAPEVDHSESQ